MNLKQAEKICGLLREARHPRTDPITCQFYTDEEYAELGEPYVYRIEHEQATSDGPEMLKVALDPARLQGDRELFLDDEGRVWTWSSIQIPHEDCECECGQRWFSDSEPLPPERCPHHGGGVREIECFRRAIVSWRLSDDRPTRWRFRVAPGAPIRDVLAEYRAERELKKTADAYLRPLHRGEAT
jgi:hypothetical protein